MSERHRLVCVGVPGLSVRVRDANRPLALESAIDEHSAIENEIDLGQFALERANRPARELDPRPRRLEQAEVAPLLGVAE